MADIRERVPARWIDLVRDARDVISPSRRKPSEQVSDTDRQLALAISPEGRVLAGPFEGLQLPIAGSWGGHAARLAGAYEEEIAESIEEAISRQPRMVVDVGAAEGYYAVGIARRLPACQVIAYDIAREARKICAQTAQMNGVSNIQIRGRATPRELQRCLLPGALLLCDVEGYERELLNPEIVPALRSAHVIVELHEFANPGVTRVITKRFTASHTIRLATVIPKVIGDRPQLAHVDSETALHAMREGRPTQPPMQWAIMSPLAGESAHMVASSAASAEPTKL